MEVGSQAASPKGKGKGKGTKQAAVLKTDNRTETPEIKKDEGVENPDKDALELTAGDTDDVPDVENKETESSPTGENDEHLADKIETEGDNGGNTEEVVDIEEAGTGRFVTEALDRNRDNEKQAFQTLINENVKTQSELEKVSAELASVKLTLEERSDELEVEKQKTTELEAKVHELQVQVKELELLRKMEEQEEEPTKEKSEEAEENKEDECITTEQKLKDLQLRLKRMARDEEDKDKYIAELTRQLKASDDALDDLEPQVDKGKWQEVMDKRKAAVEQSEDSGTSDEWLTSDNLVRRSDNMGRSKVCVIM